MSKQVADPLDVIERKRWIQIRKVIAEKKEALWELVAAVAEAKEKRLYRENYTSFEAFVETELGWKSTRAYELMEACEVRKELLEISSSAPNTESHLAELAKATPEVAAKVWKQVTEKAEETGKEPTAKQIRDTIYEIAPETKPEPKAKSASKPTEPAREPGDEPPTIAEQVQAAHEEIEGGLLLRITQAITAVKSIGDRFGFELLRTRQRHIRDQLEIVKGDVVRHTPDRVCPVCDGEPDGCTRCGNHGWVAKD